MTKAQYNLLLAVIVVAAALLGWQNWTLSRRVAAMNENVEQARVYALGAFANSGNR